MDSIESKIQYWMELAIYDLDTAESMLKTKRLLYMGFMCHQVFEKSLKAYYWHINKKEPPYTHNLLILCNKTGLDSLLSENQRKLINLLMPLNIQARYPEDKESLSKSLTLEVCKKIYNETREFYIWIKQLLKS